MHPEVHTTGIAQRGALAILPPRGGGGGEAVGAAKLGGDGEGNYWGRRSVLHVWSKLLKIGVPVGEKPGLVRKLVSK